MFCNIKKVSYEKYIQSSFLRQKDKQKSNGNYPIMCRITVDGEASRFNTKVDVKPENWNAKTGRRSTFT